MIILGIETSCDETAAAVIKIDNNKLSVLSNVVNSQIDIHKQYGGIIPEVAAREHIKNILPIIELSLKNADINSSTVDLIAVTQGPGLATSLMVGLETAKTLALAWDKPLVPVNHLAGHLWSWLLPVAKENKLLPNIKFPYLALIISGGHTELVLLNSFNDYKLIGQTLDDAVGEAFDKVAKMLGLGYPGGPELDRMAERGDPTRFSLPRPMIESGDSNFSLAGLKTAVLYKTKKENELYKKYVADMAASFQAAVGDVLISKTLRAAEKYNINEIVVGGGVIANKYLRKRLSLEVSSAGLEILFPDFTYTGDNAAMIALAGYFCTEKKKDFLALKALPNLTLT